MKNCELSSQQMYKKLISVFPELEDWTQKDIIEIRKFLNEDSVVLEIGCSWGRIIKALSPSCKKFIGIDNSEVEIKEAKSFLKNINNVEVFLRMEKKHIFLINILML